MYTMSTTGVVKLDRERVLTAAIALADEASLDAMSMRRLADSLGVTAMALYKHFRNRDELVTGMVDAALGPVLSAIEAGSLDGGSWRERATSCISACRAVVHRHEWLRDAIAQQTHSSPVALAYMDRLIRLMLDGGLDIDTVHHVMHALSTRMWGFTLEVFPTPRLPDDEPARTDALRTYQVDYPGIVAMTTVIGAQGGCDEDAEFLFALEAIFDRAEADATRFKKSSSAFRSARRAERYVRRS